MTGTCISLILGMPFYMEIFKKKFTWSNLWGLLLRGDREGVSSSEISVWFETKSLCLEFDICHVVR